MKRLTYKTKSCLFLLSFVASWWTGRRLGEKRNDIRDSVLCKPRMGDGSKGRRVESDGKVRMPEAYDCKDWFSVFWS